VSRYPTPAEFPHDRIWIPDAPPAPPQAEAPAHGSLTRRLAIFVYGVLSYVSFLAVFLYTVGFVGNFGVPKSIDAAPQVPLLTALLTNVALLALFAVQHSVMARPSFKRAWTRIVPEVAERSTYVLLSNVALGILFVFWQPMGGVVWEVSSEVGRVLIYGAFATGWVILLVSTFLINHFDLFGLRQVWLQLLGRPYAPLEFRTRLLYRLVRHPLYVGWLLGFWATPTMTSAHLVFALTSTVYILVAIWFEERNLVEAHPEYEAYRRRVPMLLPRLRRL